jgi:predicted ATPase with chaperone activity
VDCRVWGVLVDRLVEVRVASAPGAGPGDAGFAIEGLPEDRSCTSADRVRAALLNSGLVSEAPSVTLHLEPAVGAGPTSDLDLALALAALAHCGFVGAGLRWILANGRLGLGGTVFAPGLSDHPALAEVARTLCHTPVVESERTFEREAK